MISKGDLETVFQAWYDHKMEPDDPELLRVHRVTINNLTAKMEDALGHPITVASARQAIIPRFGVWMKENGLPQPPK